MGWFVRGRICGGGGEEGREEERRDVPKTGLLFLPVDEWELGPREKEERLPEEEDDDREDREEPEDREEE